MLKAVEQKEKQIWDTYFAEALSGSGQEMENSNLWWTISERDTIDIVKKLFGQKPFSVCEAGCGSGGSSFSLIKEMNVTELCLMDVSANALSYAKKIAPKDIETPIQYKQVSILSTQNTKQQYDFVWNTGLIEHYQPNDIITIVKNMLNITKDDGIVMIGIPNKSNIAVIKARILGSKFGSKYLKFIPGYRNTTEIPYTNKHIKQILSTNFENHNIDIRFAGSPLFAGTPEFIVKFADILVKCPRNAFLTYFIIKKGIQK